MLRLFKDGFAPPEDFEDDTVSDPGSFDDQTEQY